MVLRALSYTQPPALLDRHARRVSLLANADAGSPGVTGLYGTVDGKVFAVFVEGGRLYAWIDGFETEVTPSLEASFRGKWPRKLIVSRNGQRVCEITARRGRMPLVYRLTDPFPWDDELSDDPAAYLALVINDEEMQRHLLSVYSGSVAVGADG